MKKLFIMLCVFALVLSSAVSVSAVKSPIAEEITEKIDFKDDTDSKTELSPKMLTPEEDLIRVFITQEELEIAKESGLTMRVWLEIVKKKVSDISTDIDKVVQDANKEIKTEFGCYVDLILSKQIGSNPADRLYDADDEVLVQANVPSDLLNADKSKVRTYKILSYLDGGVKVIPVQFNAEDQTISFKTNRFSTCALVYTDTKKENDSPKTGDNSGVVALMLMVVAAGAVVVSKKAIKA